MLAISSVLLSLKLVDVLLDVFHTAMLVGNMLRHFVLRRFAYSAGVNVRWHDRRACIPRKGAMVTIVALVVAALVYGYVRRYPMDRLIGIGIAGALSLGSCCSAYR